VHWFILMNTPDVTPKTSYQMLFSHFWHFYESLLEVYCSKFVIASFSHYCHPHFSKGAGRAVPINFDGREPSLEYWARETYRVYLRLHTTTPFPKLGVGNPLRYQIQGWLHRQPMVTHQLPIKRYHRRPVTGTPSPKLR